MIVLLRYEGYLSPNLYLPFFQTHIPLPGHLDNVRKGLGNVDDPHKDQNQGHVGGKG